MLGVIAERCFCSGSAIETRSFLPLQSHELRLRVALGVSIDTIIAKLLTLTGPPPDLSKPDELVFQGRMLKPNPLKPENTTVSVCGL